MTCSHTQLSPALLLQGEVDRSPFSSVALCLPGSQQLDCILQGGDSHTLGAPNTASLAQPAAYVGDLHVPPLHTFLGDIPLASREGLIPSHDVHRSPKSNLSSHSQSGHLVSMLIFIMSILLAPSLASFLQGQMICDFSWGQLYDTVAAHMHVTLPGIAGCS